MITICKLCGKRKKNEEEICEECRNNEKDNYYKIKAFLVENPDSNILQIAKATGLEISNINRFINEGRFDILNKG